MRIQKYEFGNPTSTLEHLWSHLLYLSLLILRNLAIGRKKDLAQLDLLLLTPIGERLEHKALNLHISDETGLEITILARHDNQK